MIEFCLEIFFISHSWLQFDVMGSPSILADFLLNFLLFLPLLGYRFYLEVCGKTQLNIFHLNVPMFSSEVCFNVGRLWRLVITEVTMMEPHTFGHLFSLGVF